MYRLKDLQQPLMPGLIGLFLIECAFGILKAGPFHQIVNILEMIIEGHAVNAAVVRDVAHRDLRERLFQQQILQ